MDTSYSSEFNSELITKFLKQKAPYLQVQSLESLRGDDHYVVEVNHEWIFRFPKNNEVKKLTAAELHLLKILSCKISYEIPRAYYHFKTMYAYGYRKIIGQLLSKEIYASLSFAQQQHLADDCAEFLYELHRTIDLATATNIGIPKADWPLFPDDLEKGLVQDLEKFYLNDFFKAFIKHYKDIYQNTRLTLIHNDFHADNILIDPKTAYLRGVIDFTSASIGDSYLDFRYLFLIDIKFAEMVVEQYANKAHTKPDLLRAYTYYLATEFSRLYKALISQHAANEVVVRLHYEKQCNRYAYLVKADIHKNENTNG